MSWCDCFTSSVKRDSRDFRTPRYYVELLSILGLNKPCMGEHLLGSSEKHVQNWKFATVQGPRGEVETTTFKGQLKNPK